MATASNRIYDERGKRLSSELKMLAERYRHSKDDKSMKTKIRMVLAVVCISVFSIATFSGAQTMKHEGLKNSDSIKIRLKVNDRIITATMIDSKTTRDFISLLPLTLAMNDLLFTGLLALT
jgi:hypothetical protein